MMFLAPMAGLIAAALAIPALLTLYLLRLRRRPLRVSSTLLWEQAAKDLQVNVPIRMLRWSWLLLLHALALACFLIAIARPAIGDGGPAGSRIVIVVDRSASMNAADAGPINAESGPTSRLEAAKRRARELVDSIGRAGASTARPRCMVIEMGAGPRALTAFTPDLATLREAIDSITPSDQPENLPETLRLIEAVTADAAAEESTDSRPAVYLITDGVADPPTPQQRRGLRIMTLTVPSAADALADPVVDNVGLVAVNARFDSEDASLIRIFARLVNAGAAAVDVAVRCTIDGQTPADGITSISIPGATGSGDSRTPGEAAVSFGVRPAPSAASRLVLVSIARPDALGSDDAAGVVLPPPWKPRIAVVAPESQDPDVPPEPDVFLLQALDATEPASVRIVGASTVEPRTLTPGSAAGPSPWAAADIVVFDRVEPPAAAMPSVPTISFGASLPIEELQIRSGPAGSATRALAWRRDHPALRYVGLDPLLIAPAAAIALPAKSPSDRAIESLVDGSLGPLVVEVSERRPTGGTLRRLLVAFDLARSNWGPDVSFPLFIGNAIDHLAADIVGAAPVTGSLSTADLVAVTVPSGTDKLSAGGAFPVEFNLSGNPKVDRQVQIGPFERAGVYTLRTLDGRPVFPAATVINLANDRESGLVRRLTPSTVSGPSGDVATQDGQREVWHWFIAAALGLLTAEWFVYAWLMRSS